LNLVTLDPLALLDKSLERIPKDSIGYFTHLPRRCDGGHELMFEKRAAPSQTRPPEQRFAMFANDPEFSIAAIEILNWPYWQAAGKILSWIPIFGPQEVLP